jgi:hypothetical protein
MHHFRMSSPVDFGKRDIFPRCRYRPHWGRLWLYCLFPRCRYLLSPSLGPSFFPVQVSPLLGPSLIGLEKKTKKTTKLHMLECLELEIPKKGNFSEGIGGFDNLPLGPYKTPRNSTMKRKMFDFLALENPEKRTNNRNIFDFLRVKVKGGRGLPPPKKKNLGQKVNRGKFKGGGVIFLTFL